MDVRVQSVKDDSMVVVSVSGEIDVYSAGSLRKDLTRVIDREHSDVIVDLADVTFMDSTGLGVLIGSVKQVRQFGGRVRLVVVEEKVVNLLRYTAVTELFAVYTTLEAALSAE